MYNNFKDIPTLEQYHKVLDDTVEYFRVNPEELPNALVNHVLAQLNDFKSHLNDYDSLGDEDDIYERYDLGAIAVHNLEDGSESQMRLFDIVWGIIHYKEIPE